jgi:riboflavin kinase/FMN adenylyltransferase
MKLLRNGASAQPLDFPTVAVIGNFDGVHCGHQALLSAVRAKATQLGHAMLVIIFEPQTREFFLKDQSPPRLMSLRGKVQALSEFDVDYLCCLRFDRHLANMSALMFAESIIFKKLHVRYLFVGSDFRFGCDRLGDFELLREVSQGFYAHVETFPDFLGSGQRVSSTGVRQALLENDLEQARRLLGRNYSLCGRVCYGDGLGRTWGVPTANIKLGKGALPLRGVFCVQVVCPDGRVYDGVANIGCRPTFEGKQARLEVHLLQFSGSLYGQRVTVLFLSQLRNEARFESKEALIAQIHKDVVTAKMYFNRL